MKIPIRVRSMLIVALAAGAAVATQAQAAASEAFTASITSVSADIATYGAALITVAAVGVAFMVGMKYVKKISRAA